MRTIHKYFIPEGGGEIEMPRGATVLCVQTQNGVPCLWAEVDTYEPTVQRRIDVYETGHEVPFSSRYVGTFQLHGGALVFHVYDPKGR